MNIQPTDLLGDLVARFPSVAKPLEDWGLDFCCGGKKPLSKAAEEKGLDPGTIVVLLNKAALRGLPGANPETAVLDNPGEYDTPKLISHIKYTHHAYLRRVLPDLVILAGKTAAAHGMTDPGLFELEGVVRTLAKDLGDHLETEEMVLFPKLERPLPGERASLKSVIALLEEDHQGAGQALDQIRTLTRNFTLPEGACSTYRRFMALLQELEADLHRHVHLENSVLFPRYSAPST